MLPILSRKPIVSGERSACASSRGSFGPLSRTTVVILLTWLISTQTGCQIFQRFRPRKTPAPVVFQQPPDQQQLFAHLKTQSQKVKQLKTNVRVSVDGLPTLRGTLVIERPRRLRLKAGLLGVTEMGVDVGSNDDFFWVWTKTALPGETPTLLYANHEAFKNSPIQKSLPLEPSWIIDALGFMEFGPTEHHEGPFQRNDGRYEIRSYRQTASGPTVRVSAIDPIHGWISQQAMYDSSGRRVAYVNSIEHQTYPDIGVSLPQRFEIYVFPTNGQNMKLVVDADDYTLNSLYGDPEKLWAMPDPQDVPKVDLTRVSQSALSQQGTQDTKRETIQGTSAPTPGNSGNSQRWTR